MKKILLTMGFLALFCGGDAIATTDATSDSEVGMETVSGESDFLANYRIEYPNDGDYDPHTHTRPTTASCYLQKLKDSKWVNIKLIAKKERYNSEYKGTTEFSYNPVTFADLKAAAGEEVNRVCKAIEALAAKKGVSPEEVFSNYVEQGRSRPWERLRRR